MMYYKIYHKHFSESCWLFKHYELKFHTMYRGMKLRVNTVFSGP